MAAHSLMERIATAGTTDAGKLVVAFENFSFPAAKATNAEYHGCDHQCAQEVYGGASVSAKQFEKTQFMYDIIAEVPAAESDGTCDSPWAKAATAAMAAQHSGARAGYTPKTF
jgi:hypothetical protein